MGADVSRETPPPPQAQSVFGERLHLAVEYAAVLASAGTVRGLIGPRELPRLWERHLLNCAVVTDLVPVGATVCDVGSGAGLPGVVMAIRRPDLRLVLLEPLLRRTAFLQEVVDALRLANVEVVRARAEEIADGRRFDIVTARAVAPLSRLLDWCLPLVGEGGAVLALKGQNVSQELEASKQIVERWGAEGPEILHIGESLLSFPTTVVRVRAGASRTLPLPTNRRGDRSGRPAGDRGRRRRQRR